MFVRDGSRFLRPLFCLAVVFFTPTTASSEETRVGAIFALSGEAASLGAACRNGMTLAMDELKSETPARQVKLTIEDDQNKPAATVSAFHKLAAAGTDIFITWTSSTSNAVSPLADQRRIPMVAIASDPAIVAGKSFVMTYWVSPEAEVRVVNSELKKRGIKRIARITALQNAMLAMKHAFDKEKPTDTEIVYDEEISSDAHDFKSTLVKLKQAGQIDGIFVNLYVGQVGIFARQAREMGFQTPFFNIETVEDEGSISSSNGALVGSWYVNADDPSDAFGKKYGERFPGASTFSAANCYDLIKLIAAAPVDQPLNDYFHRLKDVQSSFGLISASGDNRFTLPATVKLVTKTGFEKQD